MKPPDVSSPASRWAGLANAVKDARWGSRRILMFSTGRTDDGTTVTVFGPDGSATAKSKELSREPTFLLRVAASQTRGRCVTAAEFIYGILCDHYDTTVSVLGMPFDPDALRIVAAFLRCQPREDVYVGLDALVLNVEDAKGRAAYGGPKPRALVVRHGAWVCLVAPLIGAVKPSREVLGGAK